MSRRRRAAGAGRAGAARRRAGGQRSAASLPALLRRSLATWVGTLPAVAVTTLAAQLPTQLLLGLVFERQGITSSFLQEQYRSLADIAIGSLVLPALYAIFSRAARGEGRLADLPATLRWAYGRGPFGWVGTWFGMFMTRFLVSFVVGVAMLPALVGAWGVSRVWPAIGRLASLVAAPDQLAAEALAAPVALAPLLLVVPLLALPLAIWLRYALAEPVVALERVDGFEALKRSQALSAGARWRLAGALAVFSLPAQLAWLLLPELAAAEGPIAMGAVKACCLVLAALFGASLVEVFAAQGGAPRDARTQSEPRPAPEA